MFFWWLPPVSSLIRSRVRTSDFTQTLFRSHLRSWKQIFPPSFLKCVQFHIHNNPLLRLSSRSRFRRRQKIMSNPNAKAKDRRFALTAKNRSLELHQELGGEEGERQNWGRKKTKFSEWKKFCCSECFQTTRNCWLFSKKKLFFTSVCVAKISSWANFLCNLTSTRQNGRHKGIMWR